MCVTPILVVKPHRRFQWEFSPVSSAIVPGDCRVGGGGEMPRTIPHWGLHNRAYAHETNFSSKIATLIPRSCGKWVDSHLVRLHPWPPRCDNPTSASPIQSPRSPAAPRRAGFEAPQPKKSRFFRISANPLGDPTLLHYHPSTRGVAQLG